MKLEVEDRERREKALEEELQRQREERLNFMKGMLLITGHQTVEWCWCVIGCARAHTREPLARWHRRCVPHDAGVFHVR